MTRFLIGLASGLAIAYLTAPQPGKQTRDSLLGLANDEVEGVKLIRKAVARVEETINQVRD